MQYEKTFHLALVICTGVLAVFILNNSVFGQSSSLEKPKIKDFGQSLRQKKDKNNQKNENTNQDTANRGIEDVIKIETNLVRTNVLVLDPKGNVILGLKDDDFIVTENDVPQKIEHFSLGDSEEVPRSIVLIIDYSASQTPYLKTSIEAAKVLVDKLNPKDRMAIVTDDVELLVEFTRDKERLKKELDSLKKRRDPGKSKQYSALMATLNEMFDEEDIRPIIIFQTDGDEVSGIANEDTSLNNPISKYTTQFTAQELFNRIEKSRVTIYSVISGTSMLGLSPGERLKKGELIFKEQGQKTVPPEAIKLFANARFLQQTSMRIVARASGGFVDVLERPEQADEVYSRIFSAISDSYLIGYYPINEERDGKRRNIKIEVKGHPEYQVWGRKFYFAPESEK